jgi:hypothetical protein
VRDSGPSTPAAGDPELLALYRQFCADDLFIPNHVAAALGAAIAADIAPTPRCVGS